MYHGTITVRVIPCYRNCREKNGHEDFILLTFFFSEKKIDPEIVHYPRPLRQMSFPSPIFSVMCMFCRSLFVLLYFFYWPLCSLFFFDIQILITSLWYLQTS